jgi:hypothetical protein
MGVKKRNEERKTELIKREYTYKMRREYCISLTIIPQAAYTYNPHTFNIGLGYTRGGPGLLPAGTLQSEASTLDLKR